MHFRYRSEGGVAPVDEGESASSSGMEYRLSPLLILYLSLRMRCLSRLSPSAEATVVAGPPGTFAAGPRIQHSLLTESLGIGVYGLGNVYRLYAIG